MSNASSAGLLWVAASILLVCIAQLSLKYAMEQLPGDLDFSAYRQVFHLPYIISVALPILLGMGCYALSVGCWLAALGSQPLSVAYPLLSLSYLIVSLAAVPIFDEKLTYGRLIGIGFLILGSLFVVLPAKDSGQKSDMRH